MDLYCKATPGEQKKEILHQGMDIFYSVLGEMVGGVVSEVLDEEMNVEEDDMGLFHINWDEDSDIVCVADDMNEKATEVPACSTVGPSRAELKRKMLQDEQEEGLPVDGDFQEYVRSRKNVNTAKKTASVLRKVQGFLLKNHQEKRGIAEIPPAQLNSLMCSFILNVTKDIPEGMDPKTMPEDKVYHQPDTLTSYYTGVARYLRDCQYPVCMISDLKFSLLRSVLETRRCELKEMGLGNKPNAAIELTDEEVELCWNVGALGKKNPRTLQHTVYFLLGNAFGWRARDESYKCVWGDITLHKDGEDGTYLEWNERTSKTRKGTGEPRKFHPKLWEIEDKDKCGVALYRLMASKRPPQYDDTDAFFLTPKHRGTMEMDVGYMDSKMSYGCIGEMMKRVKEEAGLEGNIKGHSVRKTMTTNLLQQGVNPTVICQLTGHKDVNSLQSYATASKDQQKEMSDIVAGGKRPLSLKKKKTVPSAAAGSASQVVPVAPSPSVASLAPRMPSTSDIAGMFAGAHIEGNVTVHLHYGHVASSQHNLNMSPILPLQPDFE